MGFPPEHDDTSAAVQAADQASEQAGERIHEMLADGHLDFSIDLPIPFRLSSDDLAERDPRDFVP